MVGNVWEWVDNGEAEGEGRYVYGGSWVDGVVAPSPLAWSRGGVESGLDCAVPSSAVLILVSVGSEDESGFSSEISSGTDSALLCSLGSSLMGMLPIHLSLPLLERLEATLRHTELPLSLSKAPL